MHKQPKHSPSRRKLEQLELVLTILRIVREFIELLQLVTLIYFDKHGCERVWQVRKLLGETEREDFLPA